MQNSVQPLKGPLEDKLVLSSGFSGITFFYEVQLQLYSVGCVLIPEIRADPDEEIS